MTDSLLRFLHLTSSSPFYSQGKIQRLLTALVSIIATSFSVGAVILPQPKAGSDFIPPSVSMEMLSDVQSHQTLCD